MGLALLVLGALTLVIGWPRTVACSEGDPMCDGASGHEVFVWLGAALMVASLYPLAVHAVVRGLGLRAALDREAEHASH